MIAYLELLQDCSNVITHLAHFPEREILGAIKMIRKCGLSGSACDKLSTEQGAETAITD
jgi:hypothetical protein